MANPTSTGYSDSETVVSAEMQSKYSTVGVTILLPRLVAGHASAAVRATSAHQFSTAAKQGKDP